MLSTFVVLALIFTAILVVAKLSGEDSRLWAWMLSPMALALLIVSFVQGGLLGAMVVLAAIFAFLKWNGDIGWSWWWVTSPLWGLVPLLLLTALGISVIIDGNWRQPVAALLLLVFFWALSESRKRTDRGGAGAGDFPPDEPNGADSAAADR